MNYFDEYGFAPYVPEHMEKEMQSTRRPPPVRMPGNTYENIDPWSRMPSGPTGMQGMQRTSMPADFFPYSYPQNLPVALDLMRDSLMGETEDKLFYSHILNAAVSPEDRETISAIRNDEMKHYEILKKLYHELTGETPPKPGAAEDMAQMTYCQALAKALRVEVAAIERYRKILFAMQDRRHINMVTEVLTDEIRHADLYGLLLSMNNCFTRRATPYTRP